MPWMKYFNLKLDASMCTCRQTFEIAAILRSFFNQIRFIYNYLSFNQLPGWINKRNQSKKSKISNWEIFFFFFKEILEDVVVVRQVKIAET